MIYHVLPQGVPYFKANLHCHSTISDGRKTVEELKKMYMEEGYSIIAFTDHDVFIRHNDLTDEKFLALNGFEIEVNDQNYPRTCHICLIAKDKNNEIHPLWSNGDYLIGNGSKYKDQVKYDETKPPFVRHYTPACINEIFRVARESGFFSTYNHPGWSKEYFDQYGQYEGMDAMEIVNYGCITEGYLDYNPIQYEDFLKQGKKIYCVAADDNHNGFPRESKHWDSFGGFVYIGAKELTYEAVMAALEKGDFYASRGPQIYDLTYDPETREVTAKFSKAVKAMVCTDAFCGNCVAFPEGDTFTEAKFVLKHQPTYFRLTVEDENHVTADSRAYFLEDFA